MAVAPQYDRKGVDDKNQGVWQSKAEEQDQLGRQRPQIPVQRTDAELARAKRKSEIDILIDKFKSLGETDRLEYPGTPGAANGDLVGERVASRVPTYMYLHEKPAPPWR
eukprot:COSAG05_NODE_58_length_23277_cov_16.934162_16_plen_109_part_00